MDMRLCLGVIKYFRMRHRWWLHSIANVPTPLTYIFDMVNVIFCEFHLNKNITLEKGLKKMRQIFTCSYEEILNTLK